MATVKLLLEEVVLLTRRVINQKQEWLASAEDEAVLRTASTVSGRLLTPETFAFAPAALAFLLGARFSLERLIKRQPKSPLQAYATSPRNESPGSRDYAFDSDQVREADATGQVGAELRTTCRS
jgi:hypothetical protein